MPALTQAAVGQDDELVALAGTPALLAPVADGGGLGGFHRAGDLQLRVHLG